MRSSSGTNGAKTSMDKLNQTQRVLEYIKTNGSIDGWRAMNELRIMRLAARIADLKAAGIPIKTTIRYSEDKCTHWAEYSLAA